MARIDSFFKLMAEQKASDLHLSTSNPPMLRINGELVRVDYPPLQNDDLKAMVYEIAPEGKIKVFEETSDIDFGYEVPTVARYRCRDDGAASFQPYPYEPKNLVEYLKRTGAPG